MPKLIAASLAERYVARALGFLSTFLLAAASALVLTLSVTFQETLHPARLVSVIVALTVLHLMRYPIVLISREAVLYLIYVLYILFQLLWTDDLRLALYTLVPALNFAFIMILFGSLVTYHNHRTVLAGMFCGIAAGALLYSFTTGFPFNYPANFSYNAVAMMFLFGLFITLMLSVYSRSNILLRLAALVFFVHIVATTSIKTNLGIVLGLMVASVFHFRNFSSLVKRNFVPLLVLLAALGYLGASSESLMRTVERGVTRISLGIKILQAREDLPGYGGYTSRTDWQREGFAGWAENPVFGNGVESFRATIGTTSHSTPVDLLHNSGLIGFFLFYALFLSTVARLTKNLHASSVDIRFLIVAGLACFFFISLSGTVHYNPFLGAFLAISVAILRKSDANALSATDSMRE